MAASYLILKSNINSLSPEMDIMHLKSSILFYMSQKHLLGNTQEITMIWRLIKNSKWPLPTLNKYPLKNRLPFLRCVPKDYGTKLFLIMGAILKIWLNYY